MRPPRHQRHQGPGHPRHPLRGAGLPVRGAGGRARRGGAGGHASRSCASIDGPVLVHAITTKGKGYHPAESDMATRGHGLSFFDVATGKPVAKKAAPKAYTDLFAEALCERDGARSAGGGHHRRHAGGHRPHPVPAALPRAHLRRGHRRAARRHLRGRPRLRGACGRWWPSTPPSCSGPTTRSSTTWRCRSCPVTFAARPRRPGRRRRQDAPGRLRPLLPALRPRPGGDGALRRERAARACSPPRSHHDGPAALPLPARRRRWACRSTPAPQAAADRQGARWLRNGRAKPRRAAGRRPGPGARGRAGGGRAGWPPRAIGGGGGRRPLREAARRGDSSAGWRRAARRVVTVEEGALRRRLRLGLPGGLRAGRDLLARLRCGSSGSPTRFITHGDAGKQRAALRPRRGRHRRAGRGRPRAARRSRPALATVRGGSA